MLRVLPPTCKFGLQPTCCETGLNVGIKTSNIAFLLVLCTKMLCLFEILYVILENSVQTRKINY